jgi:hypothetical protein
MKELSEIQKVKMEKLAENAAMSIAVGEDSSWLLKQVQKYQVEAVQKELKEVHEIVKNTCSLEAKLDRIRLEAYLKEGFTEQQALKIIALRPFNASFEK